MNKRSYIALLVIGVIMIAVGILLPGEQIVRAFIPPKGEAYLGKLITGMWYFKSALILNGFLAVFLRSFKKYLWDDTALPVNPLCPFFQRMSPGKIVRMEWIVLLIILILALVLRLIGSLQSLYGDEIAVQQMYISRGLPVIFTYFTFVPQHVLYSILAWFSELLPLPIELSYRLPAILFGTASAVLTYLLARQIFDKVSATATGILSAAAFYGIAYSHCAKAYSATHCLILLAFIAIIRIASGWWKGTGWSLLGASLWALGYLHLYNAYLCIAITVCVICTLIWVGGGLASLKRLLFVLIITGGFLFLLYSMQLPAIIDQMARAASQPEEHLSLKVLNGWLAQLTFWGEFWSVSLFCLCIACVGMIGLFRREPLFTSVSLGIPAILFALVSINNSWIYPRYLLFTLPFFLIFCIEGARMLGRTVGVIIFVLAFLWPTSQVLARYYQVGHQNIRAAAELSLDKPAYSYGLARDMFPFYNPNIKRVLSLSELKALKGDYYLMYGYRNSWRGRENEFRYIDQSFIVVKRFDGMNMELFETDGEVVLMRSKR